MLKPPLLRINRGQLVYLIAYGFILAIFNAAWTSSVALNGAAPAPILVYCSAGFTTLLGRRFIKERLDWIKLLAVTFSLGGCVLVAAKTVMRLL